MGFGGTEQGPGQRYGLRIALQGRPLDGRTSGKAQAEQLGGLVESFARGIVDRCCQPPVPADAFHAQQLAVAARGEQ
jgi:hypothetical protein